jgi:transcriptional regulator with XRE-family HTH domain
MSKRKTPIKYPEIVERFAERLRELRTSHGLTQAELGRMAHITTSYVGRLEAGGGAPGIDLVARLAAALHTTVHELLPTSNSPDTEANLRDRAKHLADQLISNADRETLLMLCPLFARIGESPTRRR